MRLGSAIIGALGCIVLVALAVGSCSATGNGTDPNDGPGGGGSSGGSTNVTSAGGAGGNAGLPNLGGNGTGGSGTGGFEECVGVSSMATGEKQPADIILAVDTSGSMDEESAEVQTNLNNFAALIVASGIDVHVVLIADASVCIPAPLGSGACGGADENLPSYQHVLQTVNSTDALQLIVATYPDWSASLRPEATKTLAVVSDDDSSLSASDFTTQLLALDPPTFNGFKFDAIVSSTSPDACLTSCFFNCGACTNPCCDTSMFCTPIAAEEGTVYKELIAQTMGVYGDLCSQDFDPVFQDMATAVIQGAQLSCEYDIPRPPDGATLDPNLVNVVFKMGDGSPEISIGHVPGAGECGPEGGWYYDDPVNPTKIFVCPATCDTLQGAAMGQVDVVFGCETVDIVPR